MSAGGDGDVAGGVKDEGEVDGFDIGGVVDDVAAGGEGVAGQDEGACGAIEGDAGEDGAGGIVVVVGQLEGAIEGEGRAGSGKNVPFEAVGPISVGPVAVPGGGVNGICSEDADQRENRQK